MRNLFPQKPLFREWIPCIMCYSIHRSLRTYAMNEATLISSFLHLTRLVILIAKPRMWHKDPCSVVLPHHAARGNTTLFLAQCNTSVEREHCSDYITVCNNKVCVKLFLLYFKDLKIEKGLEINVLPWIFVCATSKMWCSQTFIRINIYVYSIQNCSAHDERLTETAYVKK